MTTSTAVRCYAVPMTDWKLCLKQQESQDLDWPRADLEIQSFIRLASGGIDAGFDRILIR